jgi:hypothetical protein
MRSLLILLALFPAATFSDLVDCDLLQGEDCIPQVFGVSICCGPADSAFLSCVGGTVQQTDCEDSEESCFDGAADDGGALCM